MSLSTALIPYTAPKPTAQFIAEQAMNEQQIMRWEARVRTRFYPLDGHTVCGQITAAKKTAEIVVRLFDGVLLPPVAKLVTHYVGYDYGDGFDFYFAKVLPDGTAQFRAVEAVDHDNVLFGASVWDEFGYELLHSEAFEAEQEARHVAEAQKWGQMEPL